MRGFVTLVVGTLLTLSTTSSAMARVSWLYGISTATSTSDVTIESNDGWTLVVTVPSVSLSVFEGKIDDIAECDEASANHWECDLGAADLLPTAEVSYVVGYAKKAKLTDPATVGSGWTSRTIPLYTGVTVVVATLDSEWTDDLDYLETWSGASVDQGWCSLHTNEQGQVVGCGGTSGTCVCVDVVAPAPPDPKPITIDDIPWWFWFGR